MSSSEREMPLPLLGRIGDNIFVFRVGSDDIENVEQLKVRVREGVSRLKGLEIGDELGVKILSQLIEGRMTVSEIVERIYHFTVSGSEV